MVEPPAEVSVTELRIMLSEATRSPGSSPTVTCTTDAVGVGVMLVRTVVVPDPPPLQATATIKARTKSVSNRRERIAPPEKSDLQYPAVDLCLRQLATGDWFFRAGKKGTSPWEYR